MKNIFETDVYITARVMLTIFMVMLAVMLFNPELAAQAKVTEWYKNAQKSSDAGTTVYLFDANLRSTDTLTSNDFDFLKTNGVFLMTRYATADSGNAKPKLTIIRQAYFMDTWTTVKTITTADSLETLQEVQDTLKFTKSRYLFIGATNNPVDTRVKVRIRAFKQ